jgi:hypothetical protein
MEPNDAFMTQEAKVLMFGMAMITVYGPEFGHAARRADILSRHPMPLLRP